MEKVSRDKPVYIHTFGCPKNTADSEHIAYMIKQAGYDLVYDAVEAKVIIINSCTFIDDAKKESVDGILEAIRLKEEDPEIKIIVAGCLAQRYAQELSKELPEVDAYVGTNEYDKIPQLLDGMIKERAVLGDINAYETECGRYIMDDDTTSAFIKISEGCNKFCTYCIIPYIKGRHRSRKIEDITQEARMLAESGKNEIILVAQDTGEYGTDLYGKHCISTLIKEIEKIDGIEWIRLLYVYPETIDDELIQCYKESKKLVHYIDIPFQHINDRILKAMNRHTSSREIRDIIAKLRENIPDIAIRSTFICGFPGETDEDVEELRTFLSEERLTRAGVFTYSQEEGTVAAAMPDQIDENIKQERFEILMQEQERVSEVTLQSYIGRIMKVLVEEYADDDLYVGRSYLDAPDIDGCVYIESEEDLEFGKFYEVEITDSYEYDLCGRIAKC